MTTSLVGPGAALASAAIWAFASTRYAALSKTIGSAGVNLTRVLVVLPLFVLMTILFVPTGLHGMTGARAFSLFISVLCSYACADLLFFAAARSLGISTALAIASAYPMWAAIWGTVVNHEQLRATRVIGILLCLAGVISLVAIGRTAHLQKQRFALGGIALALLTSFLWAGNNIFTKAGAGDLSPWMINLVRYSIALPILLALHFGKRGAAPSLRPGFQQLIFVSIAEAFGGSTLFVYGLSHSDLSLGTTLTSLSPLFAVPIAVLLGEEHWSVPRALCILITVAGVILLMTTA